MMFVTNYNIKILSFSPRIDSSHRADTDLFVTGVESSLLVGMVPVALRDSLILRLCSCHISDSTSLSESSELLLL